MTRDLLEAWAKSGEGETLEFKKTTGERVEAVRTLCAMLNHRGGRVVFGITDDRKVVGQQVSGSTIEHLADAFKQIDPPAYPSVEQVPIEGDKAVIVVTVAPGHGRPYSWKSSPGGRSGRERNPEDAERSDPPRADG
jgi:ATP-dependent DNA helicase RecG